MYNTQNMNDSVNTNQNNFTKEQKKITRPSHGTGLALLIFIVSVAYILNIKNGFDSKAIKFFFLIFSIANIFISFGIFKGKKWALISSIVIVVSNSIILIISNSFAINYLIVVSIIVYAQFVCFNHPFYNQKS